MDLAPETGAGRPGPRNSGVVSGLGSSGGTAVHDELVVPSNRSGNRPSDALAHAGCAFGVRGPRDVLRAKESDVKTCISLL